MGNSRWIEFTDVDGEKRWRRLSGVETARAFGMEETELAELHKSADPVWICLKPSGACGGLK
jgi:hypothetical protein